ncbi:MAG: tetratricopeptide repeat protein [Selenomonadaceae bacterium]|nr:tetratricopeptide repeat protein [Selenomonadaceae bacterium]
MFERTLLIVSLFMAVNCSAVFAAVQTFTATDGYTMSDYDNPNVAEQRAIDYAMRRAAEQAGVYVESLSIVQEGMLTKDEIMVLSANVMQVQGTPKFKASLISDDVIRYECHLSVLVDTDNISPAMVQDKAALAAAVEKNKELTAEVERLNREMERLKEQYASAVTDSERQQIRQAVKQNDEYFIAAGLNEQGASLFAQGRYAEAVNCFTQAIEKNPRLAFAYHNRGSAYGKMKNYTQAIADFSQAIALDTNYATAYSGRGFAYYGTKTYERAAADFSKAISLNPQYAEAYYGRGNVYMTLGHYEEALRDYEKALVINPTLDAARQNIEMIRNAMNN